MSGQAVGARGPTRRQWEVQRSKEMVGWRSGCRLPQPEEQEGLWLDLWVPLLRLRDGSRGQACTFPASQSWAPESAENPGPGEEAAAQSQKLLRERWQQDAIVRPQSRYFRGNQKHQLGK